MKGFLIKANSFKSLTIVAKVSIFDVCGILETSLVLLEVRKALKIGTNWYKYYKSTDNGSITFAVQTGVYNKAILLCSKTFNEVFLSQLFNSSRGFPFHCKGPSFIDNDYGHTLTENFHIIKNIKLRKIITIIFKPKISFQQFRINLEFLPKNLD